jgi:ribonucleotide monophosphatase NagD (HAD superfamily)
MLKMNATEFATKFEVTANAVAARYGGKVYLVGSALSKKNPRDYDVRVVIEDDDFRRLFGWNDEKAADWAARYDQLKNSRQFSMEMALNIDFQVQKKSDARFYGRQRPKMRLDKAPDDFFEAGL